MTWDTLTWSVPVVHEYVRLPEISRWNSDIFNIIVLWHIPPHVGVCPLLKQIQVEFYGFIVFCGQCSKWSTRYFLYIFKYCNKQTYQWEPHVSQEQLIFNILYTVKNKVSLNWCGRGQFLSSILNIFLIGLEGKMGFSWHIGTNEWIRYKCHPCRFSLNFYKRAFPFWLYLVVRVIWNNSLFLHGMSQVYLGVHLMTLETT